MKRTVINLISDEDDDEPSDQNKKQQKRTAKTDSYNRKSSTPEKESKRAISPDLSKKKLPGHSDRIVIILNTLKMTRISYLRSLSEQTYSNTVQHMLQGDIESMIQFSFMVDIDWFMSLFPAAHTCREIKFIHGFPPDHPIVAEAEAKYPNLKMKSPKMPLPYGIHHTKAMLLFYRDQTMRVIIMTANMLPQDWGQKTQQVYASPLLHKKQPGRSNIGSFEMDLCAYLRSYGDQIITPADLQLVQSFDYSPCADVILIASVPGRHSDREREKWGHLRLRKMLSTHLASHNIYERDEIRDQEHLIIQSSSIGSWGPTLGGWLGGEFLTSLDASGLIGGSSSSTFPPVTPELKIIYPTVENVRNSLEGYEAGGSLPFDVKNYIKQRDYMRPLCHQWQAQYLNRTRAMPHVKSYARVLYKHSTTAGNPAAPVIDLRETRLQWYLVTSCNISKAGWGCLERNGTQLTIRNFELGVLFLPRTKQAPLVPLQFHVDEIQQQAAAGGDYMENDGGGGAGKPEAIAVPLPYDLPLTPYGPVDECWTWNTVHQLPDLFGQTWSPGSRE